MARQKDYAPGETAEVWVQDRGGNEMRLRGTVVIEDLSGIVTSIASRSGANGPQSPVTQYILQQATEHLAQRLAAEVDVNGVDSAPKMLSAALGHQPFIETVLDMSQHQMLRRWPRAADWYHDVVAFIMRPRRFQGSAEAVMAKLPEWLDLPFGEFVRHLSAEQLVNDHDRSPSRVADAIGSLWPDYPPVKRAFDGYRMQVARDWIPFYEQALLNYGLTVAPGVTMTEVAWAFNAMNGKESQERLADPEQPWFVDPDGVSWSWTGRGSMMLIAGAVVDVQGNYVRPPDLYHLKPLSQR